MNAEQFWKKVAPPNERGCMEWTGHRMKGGYGRVHSKKVQTLAHRMAWMLTHGPIPKHDSHHGTMVVCHKCDNPACCNPEHLFLGTQVDNVKDRDVKGRCGAKGQRIFGERSGAAKLTEADVHEIRRLRKEGITTVALSKRYNVNTSVISRAARGITWPHI